MLNRRSMVSEPTGSADEINSRSLHAKFVFGAVLNLAYFSNHSGYLLICQTLAYTRQFPV